MTFEAIDLSKHPIFHSFLNTQKLYESWPRLFGQLPAVFRWISAGVC